MDWGQSSCGRQATVVAMVTTATVTVTPTASTPCPSAARRRTVTCRGTRRRARPPSRPPTAAGPAARNKWSVGGSLKRVAHRGRLRRVAHRGHM